VTPTLLEATGIVFPDRVNGIEQKPLAGQSFVASFIDPEAPARTEQYFEVFSNRSMYADGWKANAQHTLPWRQDLAPGNWDEDRWELYDLDADFSEANDLAADNPEKLDALKAAFDAAAEQYGIYPLDDRGAARLALSKPPPPGSDPEATTFTYFAGATRLPETAAPNMKNRSWTVTAEVETGGSATEGVIMAFGGVAAGFVLYLDEGKPVFHYNYFEERTAVAGDDPLPKGRSTVTLDFAAESDAPGAGALATLSVNGEKVAEGHIEATVAGRFGVDTFGIGEDSSQPVTFDYQPPFAFTGTIDRVSIVLQ
jgi:arylsulfatase